MDGGEVNEDLVRDMTEMLTSMWAGLYGQRAGEDRATRALAAVAAARGAVRLMAKFDVPQGWCVQAFRFTLDPTEDQASSLARHFGARRKAYNDVATLKANIEAWQAAGTPTAKPSLGVLRKRWNTVKDEVCVNTQTGAVWWPECSKEAYADGITGAVDAYWNWQTVACWSACWEKGRVPAV